MEFLTRHWQTNWDKVIILLLGNFDALLTRRFQDEHGRNVLFFTYKCECCLSSTIKTSKQFKNYFNFSEYEHRKWISFPVDYSVWFELSNYLEREKKFCQINVLVCSTDFTVGSLHSLATTTCISCFYFRFEMWKPNAHILNIKTEKE